MNISRMNRNCKIKKIWLIFTISKKSMTSKSKLHVLMPKGKKENLTNGSMLLQFESIYAIISLNLSHYS